MDRGAWWAIVHSIAKSQTQLKQFSMHDPWVRKIPGDLGNGYQLEFFCLENPMDREPGRLQSMRSSSSAPRRESAEPRQNRRSLMGCSPWGCKE